MQRQSESTPVGGTGTLIKPYMGATSHSGSTQGPLRAPLRLPTQAPLGPLPTAYMYMGAEAGARSTRQWGAPLGKSTTWQYSCTTLTWQYVGIPAAHHRELAQLPALQLIIQQLSLALRRGVRKGDAGILCEGVRSEVRKGDARILCEGVRSEVRKGDAGIPSHRCSGCVGQRPHSFQGCALSVLP